MGDSWLSDIESSAKKMFDSLIEKGLPERQVRKIVKRYKEEMLKIRKGKPKLDLVNKPKGKGEWTTKKVERRKEEMRKSVRH